MCGPLACAGAYDRRVSRSSFALGALATLVVLSLCAVAPACAAELVTVEGTTWLKGEILPQDARMLAERRRPGMVVNLDSGGGHVLSAMAIGRLLRQMNAVARVEARASCSSACVLVLAGAPVRVVQPGAVIGVHRPYDPKGFQLSAGQKGNKDAMLDSLVRSYLREVRVPPALYDAMLNAPQGRTLSPSELSWYGLNANERGGRIRSSAPAPQPEAR
jgi:hypothetical protein